MTDDMEVNWVSAEAITPLARGEKNISSSKILETTEEACQRELEEIAEAKVSSILRILSKVIFTEALQEVLEPRREEFSLIQRSVTDISQLQELK
jgi:hypothetical protein